MRTVLHMHTLIIQLSELHAEFLMFKILIIQRSELHAELLMFNTLIIYPSERHAYRLFQTCLKLGFHIRGKRKRLAAAACGYGMRYANDMSPYIRLPMRLHSLFLSE